jgi:hypothetical protein
MTIIGNFYPEISAKIVFYKIGSRQFDDDGCEVMFVGTTEKKVFVCRSVMFFEIAPCGSVGFLK